MREEKRMAVLEITVTERIEFPDDAEIEYAPTGVASGVRLSDGRLVKPWVALELETEDGSDAHDMSGDEVEALGLGRDIDFERTIEHV